MPPRQEPDITLEGGRHHGAVATLPDLDNLGTAELSYSQPGQPNADPERYVLRRQPHATARFVAAPLSLSNREDVSLGLGVVQNAYTVAMILGFKVALEPSYWILTNPFESPSGQIPHSVLLLTLITIMLLGFRLVTSVEVV